MILNSLEDSAQTYSSWSEAAGSMGFTPEALQDEDEAEVEEEKSNYNNSARDENSERKMIKS